MPNVPAQKAASRARIVESAVSLFGTRGFDNVSIDDVMAHAGMTRGGFYRHFSTKAELFAEAIRTGLVGDVPDEWPADVDTGTVGFEALMRSYLAASHLDRDDACPLIRFPESAARGGADLRDAYTDVAKSIHAALESSLGTSDASEAVALAALALCVGGMVIAAGVNDPAFADAVRAACIDVAVEAAATP